MHGGRRRACRDQRHGARGRKCGGVVPRIWWYELRNALLMNERRGRITRQQASDTLADSLEMGISIDEAHEESLLLDLARRFNLSVYDAAYLETALRRSLPLATLDRRLRRAAEAARDRALAASRLTLNEAGARKGTSTSISAPRMTRHRPAARRGSAVSNTWDRRACSLQLHPHACPAATSVPRAIARRRPVLKNHQLIKEIYRISHRS